MAKTPDSTKDSRLSAGRADVFKHVTEAKDGAKAGTSTNKGKRSQVKDSNDR